MGSKKRIVVTGLSVMSANGQNKDEFLKNSLEGTGGIHATNLFPTDKLRTKYFGQLKQDYIYEVESLEDESRTEAIFEELKNQLFEDAGLSKAYFEEKEEETGFSFATSIGVNDYVVAHVKGTVKDSISKSNIYKLAESLGIDGPVYVNTSACAAGSTALGVGYSLIQSGTVDMVVAGGVDPLTEFSSYGFHSLQNLSEWPCKPFDKDRTGISIGEGGALFILETLESAKKRNAKIYGEILGYGLGNDAYHATSPDPTGNGALRVMKKAVEQAGLVPDQIEYINAHGTGTIINDSMEIKAIKKINETVFVTSTKSYTGHCLAAAGAIEFAATLLCIQNQVIFPTINLDTPLEEGEEVAIISGKAKTYPLQYALSNSFAFAGNAASLAIGRCELE